jgi:hypothetical protein
MQFKTITYQRVKNLGNYESERLELSVELNEDDDVDDAIDLLKSIVLKSLDLEDNQAIF